MAWKAIALYLVFCGCLTIVRAQNVSSCYFCQEDDAVCKDPVNVAILPSLKCAELDYSSRSTPVQDIGLSAQIRSIMVNDVEPRTQSGADVSYQCAKLVATIRSESTNTVTQGVLRTCIKKAPDVDSMCDFMLEQIPSNYTITFCNVCDSDKCNDSASLSAVVGVVFLSLAGLLLK